jgi:hypothetical protein
VTAGELTGHGTAKYWPDRQALDGPFTSRQLMRLDEALRYADNLTGFTFSLYVGDLDEPVRETAVKLHTQLADPARCLLVAVSPNQGALEIVTGAVVRRRLLDRECELIALNMVRSFQGGDLAGGIVNGIVQLADHSGSS